MNDIKKSELEINASLWAAFLNDITAGDEQYQEYLQRLLGYSATGLTTENRLYICVGPAGSGKTTFATIVTQLLGDYAWYAPASVLLHPDERLRANRLLAVECDEDTRIDTTYLNTIVSGGLLRTRKIAFKSTSKVWLFCRRPPKALNHDHELLKKVMIIPFACRSNRKNDLQSIGQKLQKNGFFKPFIK